MTITHLRHVDLAVPDFATQRRFYTELWGLAEVGTDSGLSYLAAEGSPERYVVRLRQADEKRLDLIAFGTKGRAAVDALAARLAAAGVRLVREPGPRQTAGGGYGVRFIDVDGRTTDVSADVDVRSHRRIEEGESVWDTADPMSELIARESFNDVDRGAFVAPPV
jgi:catechol 2,3-dioxygenase-like lactoylglutathione lyase family enzyme